MGTNARLVEFVFWTMVTVMSFIVPCATGIGRSLRFDWNCGEHLMRAARASTVEIAIEELESALRWLKANHMTRGHTSLIIPTPLEDVGQWYRNLNAELRTLRQIDPATQQHECALALQRVRNVVTRDDEEALNLPSGIENFPHNWGFAIFNLAGVLGVVVGFVNMIAVAVSR